CFNQFSFYGFTPTIDIEPKKELTDFSKNQLALYFYNNSNNVAILLPQGTLKWLKPHNYGLFKR
ncbi:MAG: hypothetical protein ACLTMM_03530, partial [Lachnospiraceae bacterium]